MRTLLLTLLLSVLDHSEGRLRKVYKDTGLLLSAPLNADVGQPLILTPFVRNGSIAEGQRAALVNSSQFLDVTSYAGYFTVDERFDSNLWFWYFPSAGNVTQDPVVLWLNGGPGSTSLNGLFDENGPFIVGNNLSVSLREYSWHKNHSLIFVDNPAGVGFSYTNGGFARNETKVGDDMFSALTQFFQLFPELQQNPFYISGESYAGKYLPAIGYAILKKSPDADLKINLQGILIGDGWTDPINQLNYAPFVYNTGLVSAEVRDQLDQIRLSAVQSFNNGRFNDAFEGWNQIVSIIERASRVNIYNYLEEYDSGPWTTFLNTDEVRRALHVGDTKFGDKGAGAALYDDEIQSVAPWVEELLGHYRILVFTGQVDVIVGYPMVLDYLKTLNFTGVEEFTRSSRDVWLVDREPAGYVRRGGNLTELLVRNAGHMVPRDQPKWGYEMLYKFTRNTPFV